MKPRLFYPTFPFRSTCLIWLVWVSLAPAATLLNLTLDDPKGMIRESADGITDPGSAFASSRATIASGKGGRVLPQVTSGSDTEQKPSGEARFQILTEPSMNRSAFLRISLQASSITRNAGVGIVPEGPTTAPSALIRSNRKFVQIDGGFDFFFRNSASDSPKMIVSTKIGKLGISLTTNPQKSTVALKVFAADKSIDSQGDQVGDRAAVEKSATCPIMADQIYHAAIYFHSQADDSIRVDFCLQPGVEPLNPSESTIISLDPFWLLADDSAPGIEKIVISLGRTESAQSLDLASVRLFSSPLEAFPGIELKD